MFAITSFAYITMPILVVWLSNNVEGNAKSAFATAMMIGLGNAGNLVSSNVFITHQSPKFKTGFATGLGLCLVCLVACTGMVVLLAWENRKKDIDEADLTGDEKTGFRYIL